MHSIEMISLGIFLITVFIVFRSDKKNNKNDKKNDIFLLAIGFVYSICFELINANFAGTYEYQIYAIGLLGLPLYVPCMWSVLIYFVSKQIGPLYKKYNGRIVAVLGACLMVSFDLIIDVIAVNEHLWTWYLTVDQGWHGVNFGNFVGWFVVSFLFFGADFLRGTCFFGKNRAKKLGQIKKYLVYIVALILQTLILILPCLLFGIPEQPPLFVFLLLFGFVVIGVGIFLFLKYRKLYTNSSLLDPRIREDDKLGIIDLILLLIHIYGLVYVISHNYDGVVIGLAVVLFLLHGLLFVKNNLSIAYLK